jgi:hypothetical protein
MILVYSRYQRYSVANVDRMSLQLADANQVQKDTVPLQEQCLLLT